MRPSRVPLSSLSSNFGARAMVSKINAWCVYARIMLFGIDEKIGKYQFGSFFQNARAWSSKYVNCATIIHQNGIRVVLILTWPLLSNVLLVNLTLLKITGCACQCEPSAGLSEWMYMRWALCGSAPPAGIHWLPENLYRQSLSGAISSTTQ